MNKLACLFFVSASALCGQPASAQPKDIVQASDHRSQKQIVNQSVHAARLGYKFLKDSVSDLDVDPGQIEKMIKQRLAEAHVDYGALGDRHHSGAKYAACMYAHLEDDVAMAYLTHAKIRMEKLGAAAAVHNVGAMKYNIDAANRDLAAVLRHTHDYDELVINMQAGLGVFLSRMTPTEVPEPPVLNVEPLSKAGLALN